MTENEAETHGYESLTKTILEQEKNIKENGKSRLTSFGIYGILWAYPTGDGYETGRLLDGTADCSWQT